MKTILEWLEELPQPYRDEAIANYNEEFAEENIEYIGNPTTPHFALDMAFNWKKSPQGTNYWEDLWNELEMQFYNKKSKITTELNYIDERILVEITEDNKEELKNILSHYNQNVSDEDFFSEGHKWLAYLGGEEYWFTDEVVYNNTLNVNLLDEKELEEYLFINTLANTVKFPNK